MHDDTEALNAQIPKKLMEEFRATGANKFGHKRGYITKSLVEAMKEWIERNK